MLTQTRVIVEKFLVRLSVAACLFILASEAWAPGGSGGAGCGNSGLEVAAISGEPKDLEAAIVDAPRLSRRHGPFADLRGIRHVD